MAGLLRPDDPAYADALMFLIAEAEVLDAGDFRGWLTFLAPDVRYTVPVQTTRLRDDDTSRSAQSFLLNEDRESLEFRVKRIVESNASWAYNPKSRTRRFVTNLRVRPDEGSGVRVLSNLQIMRSRHDVDAYDLITAERNDLLTCNEEGDLQVQIREVLVDQTRLGISPIPFPL